MPTNDIKGGSRCAVELDENGDPIEEHPDRIHTDACFILCESLAIAELFMSQPCTASPGALLTYNMTLVDHIGWNDVLSNINSDFGNREEMDSLQSLQPPACCRWIHGRQRSRQRVVSRSRELQDGKGYNMVLTTNETEVQIDAHKQEVHPHDMLRITYEPNKRVITVNKGANRSKKIVKASCFIHHALSPQ